ncbi:MAG: tyrosine-type recombinase/integrase [Leadbetterella sp.]
MTHLIERFTDHLKKGKYNSATVAAYRNVIFVFYNHFREWPQSKLTDSVIADYINEAKNKPGVVDPAQVGKAIKLFFQIIFNREIKITSSGKVKDEASIDLFSREEIDELFNFIKNPKHLLLSQMVYAHGLKINEVINLQINDIDLDNKLLILRSSTAKKNRRLALADGLVDSLHNYVHKNKPKVYLFSGSGGDKKYSARNIQLFFQRAVNDAQLNKSATLSTLRHSYAVHMLERGLDIHILKEILGHSNLQTTTLYTQFAEVKLENIKSPM